MELYEAKEYFLADEIGRLCIEQAAMSNTKQNFGAVLTVDDQIIGTGRNHRSEQAERLLLPGIDYAVHAEEAAMIDAHLPDNPNQTLYVIGRINSGRERGSLNIRTAQNLGYTCLRCAKRLIAFNTTVAVPTTDGWRRITPETAYNEAVAFRATKHGRLFV